MSPYLQYGSHGVLKTETQDSQDSQRPKTEQVSSVHMKINERAEAVSQWNVARFIVSHFQFTKPSADAAPKLVTLVQYSTAWFAQAMKR